jgi:hypothetical protein
LFSDIPAGDGKTANLIFTVKGEDFFITVILSSIDVTGYRERVAVIKSKRQGTLTFHCWLRLEEANSR